MEFLHEIAAALGAEDALSLHYAVIEGRGGYFQNVTRLVLFTPGKIILRGRRGEVCVEGEGLSLGSYAAGDLVIRGAIVRVARGRGDGQV